MSQQELPRIAVAGIAIESSVYAAHRADYRDFHTLEGAEVLDRYPFLTQGSPLGEAAQWNGVFYARSIPGGQVKPEVFDAFVARIVTGIAELNREAPLDGVFLDIHGAMSVVGRTDAEGYLVKRIREVVGDQVLISAAMDLHGNISPEFFTSVNLPTCYRTAPHEDTWETRQRSMEHLLEAITSGAVIVRSWVPVPILLAGEQTSTRVEPARSLYERIPLECQRQGVWDVSIWIGYAWADEPRCHASVVGTGTDAEAVSAATRSLAEQLWRVREEFDFVGPPGSLAEGLERGLHHPEHPYLISDSGDNPGAGGSGDVTWVLHQILDDERLISENSPLTYVASIFDQEVYAQLSARQPGDEVSIVAGARVDDRVAGPVTITGVLESIRTGDPHAGGVAVISRGGLRIIITEFRKAFHAVSDFADIGLDPARAKIIITKIGYLEPTLYDIARGWTLALTPGPVDQDLRRLGQHHIQRPMFPFDDVGEVVLGENQA